MLPRLVEPFLIAYGAACTAKGATRNTCKTEVHYWTQEHEDDLGVANWGLANVGRLATVRWSPTSTKTLGVKTGSVEALVQQFNGKQSPH